MDLLNLLKLEINNLKKIYMKNWIICITSIFLSLNVISQKQIKYFDDAVKEFNSGNYELSIPYFKRIAFFESNNIINYFV